MQSLYSWSTVTDLSRRASVPDPPATSRSSVPPRAGSAAYGAGLWHTSDGGALMGHRRLTSRWRVSLVELTTGAMSTGAMSTGAMTTGASLAA